MSARTKLNAVAIQGAIAVAAIIGWVCESWIVFLVAAVVLIITAPALRRHPAKQTVVTVALGCVAGIYVRLARVGLVRRGPTRAGRSFKLRVRPIRALFSFPSSELTGCRHHAGGCQCPGEERR